MSRLVSDIMLMQVGYNFYLRNIIILDSAISLPDLRRTVQRARMEKMNNMGRGQSIRDNSWSSPPFLNVNIEQMFCGADQSEFVASVPNCWHPSSL
jgi:hypothetical protein